MRHWEAEWARTRPTTWSWVGAKEPVAVAKLIKLEGGLEEVKARMTRILESTDRWTAEHAAPSLLLSHWNDWGGQRLAFGAEPTGVDAIKAYAVKHFGGLNGHA